MVATRSSDSESENIANSLDKQVERAASAAHATVDRVSSAAQPALNNAVTNAHAAVDNMAQGAVRAAETVGAKGARLKTLQQEWTEQTRAYVRRNPLTALGLAAGGALVLRSLLRGR
jgi:ElaB/YqjD/DUF883 family membrane-anchored ribosome-binding protein